MNPAAETRGAARASAFAVTLLAVAGVAWLHEDFGATWDESIHSYYAELALAYFRSGGEDTSVNRFQLLYNYGVFADLVPAWFHGPGFSAERWNIRHFWSALLTAVTLPCAVAFGRRLPGGVTTALFAAAMPLALPRFVGHAFTNSKDTPMAAALAAFLAALVAIAADGDLRKRRFAALAATAGLALAIRPGALVFVGLFGGSALLLWLLTGRPQRSPALSPLQILTRSAAAALAAWIAMVATWPWGLENPILHPIEALRFATLFPVSKRVLFEGQTLWSDALPMHFWAKWLAITTPPSVIALAGIGTAVALLALWRHPRESEGRAAALLLVWFYLPLALFSWRRPSTYDGMRHLLFLCPAIALLAATGAAALWQSARQRVGAITATALIALLLAPPAMALVRLHPYQALYFNAFVGGMSGAERRYDGDYWLSSYREGMEWIVANAPREGKVRVLVAADPASLHCAASYAPERFEVRPLFRPGQRAQSAEHLPKDVDYYLSGTRFDTDRQFWEAPVLHRVSRDGATLAVVKGR